MLPFATEFPVRQIGDRSAFVAEVIGWLRGIAGSTVLESSLKELEAENAYLRSDAGEELRVRELRRNGDWEAIGFRHDVPDPEGRLWRTEAVLKRPTEGIDQYLLRLRTQCIARVPGARLQRPRKPYLIRSLLENGWGSSDELLTVSDKPVFLVESAEHLAIAVAITTGAASKWLPIVYVSALGAGAWSLRKGEIERLAYDLGGIAHVVVEPSQSFSFRLRDKCEGLNPYEGTVGIAVPGQGIIKRCYIGWQTQNSKDLCALVLSTAINVREQMPSFGWDWSELQEKTLRSQREIYQGALSAEEAEELFNAYTVQLTELQMENKLLQEKLRSQPSMIGEESTQRAPSTDLVQVLGPEIYVGEISDRIRMAAKTVLDRFDQLGLDKRTSVILQRVVERLPASVARDDLMAELTKATKEPRRVARELTSLLRRRGYEEKSDNKHIRLEAAEGYDGLDTITIPKTPSDHRGLNNLKQQIVRTLGLTKLL